MSDLTFRSLYPEDIDQVSKIESSLTGSPRRAFLEKRLAVATANLGEVFVDDIGGMPLGPQTMPDSFITCAVLDKKKIAGYGFARILEGEFGARSTIVELDDIGVAPDYQGKGIGKMVIAGIEQRMKARHIKALRTQIVWSNLPMIRFFASTGFALASGRILSVTLPLSGMMLPRLLRVRPAGGGKSRGVPAVPSMTSLPGTALRCDLSNGKTWQLSTGSTQSLRALTGPPTVPLSSGKCSRSPVSVYPWRRKRRESSPDLSWRVSITASSAKSIKQQSSTRSGSIPPMPVPASVTHFSLNSWS